MITLTSEQQIVAAIRQGQHRVNAGPGSGKTRVVVERTAQLLCEDAVPSRILLVTFSKKARLELLQRIVATEAPGAHFVDVRTLHSWGYSVCREEGLCPGQGKPVVGYEVLRVLRAVWEALKLREDEAHLFTPEGLRKQISHAKVQGLTPDRARRAKFPWAHVQGLRVYEEYDRRTWQAGRPDFDDMVLRPYLFFKSDPVAVERWAAKYDHIAVDEAQDNSDQQQFVMLALADKVKSFIEVGHLDQSIYRFRGAAPGVFLDFGRRPEVTSHSITLNHRSTAPIVQACNRLIEHNTERVPILLRPGRAGMWAPRLILAPDRPAQALRVVDEIRRDLKEQIPLEEIAVLYRARRSSAPLEAALGAAGITYLVAGRRSFYDRAHVRVILDYLRLISTWEKPDPDSRGQFREALSRCYYQPRRYLGKAWLELVMSSCDYDLRDPQLTAGRWAPGNALLLRALEDGRRILVDGTLRALVEHILHGVKSRDGIDLRTHLSAHAEGSSDEEDEDASPLDDDWRQVSEEIERHETVETFLMHAERLSQAAQNTDERVPAVRLSTIHGMKGAEFRSVHLVDAIEGQLPHYYAVTADLEGDTTANVEEERRLAFVAMSRAAERLRVYAPLLESRRRSDKADAPAPSTKLSRFVTEAEIIEVVVTELTGCPSPIATATGERGTLDVSSR
mgnify:FL=1